MMRIVCAVLLHLACFAVAISASDGSILGADGTRVPLSGWVEPLPPADEGLRGHVCNIDKRPHLTKEEFVEEYRNKRPVILGGAPEEAMNFSLADLQAYVERWGDIPVSLFHPLGRPGIGAHVSSLAEFMASFTTVEDRLQSQRGKARAEGKEGTFDASALSSYHCNAQSVGYHPELAHALLEKLPHSYINPTGETVLIPNATIPSVCKLYEQPNKECTCKPGLFISGESGAGLPWHWHQEVTGNLQIWGHKRWLISRFSPPGGYNHRETHLQWVLNVYPTLPSTVFEKLPPLNEPTLFECTLGPGEIMYLPHGFYHATLNVGHSLNVGYNGCSNEEEAELNKHDADIAFARHANKPWDFVPPVIAKEGWQLLAEHRAAANNSMLQLLNGSFVHVELPVKRAFHDPYEAWRATAELEASKLRRSFPELFQPTGLAMAGYMSNFPTQDNGVSLSVASILNMHDAMLNGLRHGANLWPLEQEFQYHVSRGVLRRAKLASKDEQSTFENLDEEDQRNPRVRRSLGIDDFEEEQPRDQAPTRKAGANAPMLKSSLETWPESRRLAREVADRLETVSKLNPRFPDGFALLAHAYQILAGNRGRYFDKTPTGGGRYIDRALAAAQRALALDQRAAAVCNHVATLLARGAEQGAVEVDAEGNFVVYNSNVPAPQKYANKGEKVKRQMLEQASRQSLVHDQLVRCLDIELKLLQEIYSKDALDAVTGELSRTSDALRTLATKRQDIFWASPAKARSVESTSMLVDPSADFQQDLHAGESTITRYIPGVQAQYGSASELYHHVSVEYRVRRGLDLSLVPNMRNDGGLGPPPGMAPPAPGAQGTHAHPHRDAF